MGLVMRNGSGRRQLLIYRQALEEGDERVDVDVAGILEGAILEWRCSVCGAARTWVPGPETLRYLLRRMRDER